MIVYSHRCMPLSLYSDKRYVEGKLTVLVAYSFFADLRYIAYLNKAPARYDYY